MQQTVVGAHPDRALGARGFHDGDNRVVELGADVLRRQRAAVATEAGRVVAGQIRADLPPAHTPVHALQQVLGAVVDHRAIVGREDDRRIPVAPILELARVRAVHALRVGHDGALFPRRLAELGQCAVDGGGIDEIGALRVEGDMRALAAADGVVIVSADSAIPGPGRDGYGGVVLLAAVKTPRCLPVGDQAVELCRGLVVEAGPGFTAIEGHGGAAVVAADHDAAVVGVDPLIVVVAVGRADFAEVLAAIDGLHQRHVEHPDRVGIAGIGADMGVIPGAGVQYPMGIDVLPGLAVVIAAPQAALAGLGFDDRVDARRPAGGDRDADLADQAGQPAAEFFPAIAAVRGPVDPAALAPGLDIPGFAAVVPQRGVQYPRVGGVDGQVRGPRVPVHREDLLPAPAAIAGAVHAALRVRRPDLPLDRDPGRVRVRGVHHDPGNLPGPGQPHKRECAAGVGGLPQPFALARGNAANRRFAGADIDHVGVRGRHRDGADGADGYLAVGEVLPGGAAVGGLPDTAPGRPHIVQAGIIRHAGDGGNAPAPPRADKAVFQRVEQGRVYAGGADGARQRDGGQDRDGLH